MIVRRFRPPDAAPTYELFFDAVRNGAKTRYTQKQREAWAPHTDMPDNWLSKLANATTYVAEDARNVLGFMSLLDWAHLDMAYVAPNHMGKGVATDLYEAVEDHAAAQNLTMLTTEASHLAKSFFLKQGWQVEAAQTVERQGVEIPNFRMFKRL